MIYNTSHNKYELKIIKDGQVIEEKVAYNNARAALYFFMSNGSLSATVNLMCDYTETNDEGVSVEKSITYTTLINFVRVTEKENVRFNSEITFSGVIYLSGFGALDNATSTSWTAALGSPVYKTSSNENTPPEPYYWSEAPLGSFSSNVDGDTTIQMTITIHFIVRIPTATGGAYFYDDINRVLQIDSGYFPYPFVSSFGTSPLLSYPNPIRKQIPILNNLPSVRPNGHNPKYDSDSDVEQQPDNTIGGLRIDFDGTAASARLSGMNVGTMPTLVYKNVAACTIPSNFREEAENTSIPVPVIELNKQELTNIINELEEIEENNAYFYASLPYDATVTAVKLYGNVLNDNNFSYNYQWINPPDRIEISDDIYGYIPNNTEYNRTDNNSLSYSNFILSDVTYWEPSFGCPVAPSIINLPTSRKPTNYRMGKNIKFCIEGRKTTGNDTEWHACNVFNSDGVNLTPYKTYYLQKENYDEYRIHFKGTIPSTNSVGYYVNKAEETHITNKAYDKNVVLIGTENIYDENDDLKSYIEREGSDFGHCGVRITKNELISLRDKLGTSTTSIYYIYVTVSQSRYFYKTRDFTTTLSYSLTAREG